MKRCLLVIAMLLPVSVVSQVQQQWIFRQAGETHKFSVGTGYYSIQVSQTGTLQNFQVTGSADDVIYSGEFVCVQNPAVQSGIQIGCNTGFTTATAGPQTFGNGFSSSSRYIKITGSTGNEAVTVTVSPTSREGWTPSMGMFYENQIGCTDPCASFWTPPVLVGGLFDNGSSKFPRMIKVLSDGSIAVSSSGAAAIPDNTTISPVGGSITTTCADGSVGSCGAGSTVEVIVSGYQSASFGISPLSATGTLKCDYTQDGTTWYINSITSGGTVNASSVAVGAATATCPIPPATLKVRLRSTVLASGPITITGRASMIPQPPVMPTGFGGAVSWNFITYSGGAGSGSQTVSMNGTNDTAANYSKSLILTQNFGNGSNAPVATAMLGMGSGNVKPIIACDNVASVNVTAGATTQIIPGQAAKKIYVCGELLSISLTGSYTWKSGTTATSCGTVVSITPSIPMTTGANTTFGSGLGLVLQTLSTNDDLCLTAATGNVLGMISYTIF